jgi:hypothetical protein
MAHVDERFWDLAQVAADRLIGQPADRSLAAGVLAQWIAENGWRFPPPRNNPGNLSKRWTDAFDLPCHAVSPNPQPGNPIMTFDRLGDGARCYADGLAAFKRYRHAVTAGKAGDGLGFAVAVCKAKYGTRESTVKSVFAKLSRDENLMPRRINVAIRYCRVLKTEDMVQLKKGQPVFESPGGRQVTKMSRDATVPRLGMAGTVDGKGWCAVVVATRWSYADEQTRPTGLYVPVAAVVTP